MKHERGEPSPEPVAGSWELEAGSGRPLFPPRFPQRHRRGRRLCDAGAADDLARRAAGAWTPFEPLRPGLVRHADAVGAADAGRERSRPVRSAVLARLLPPHQGRCRLPERRGHRRLLPDRGAAAPSQQHAWARAIRSGRWLPAAVRLKMHVIARTDPHAARDEVRAAHPDWIAARPDGQPDPALGQQGIVGDVRARVPTTSSSWTRCTARSSVEVQRRRHLHESLGAAGECHCVHCQRNFKAATGLELPHVHRRRGSDTARVSSSGARRG